MVPGIKKSQEMVPGTKNHREWYRVPFYEKCYEKPDPFSLDKIHK